MPAPHFVLDRLVLAQLVVVQRVEKLRNAPEYFVLGPRVVLGEGQREVEDGLLERAQPRNDQGGGDPLGGGPPDDLEELGPLEFRHLPAREGLNGEFDDEREILALEE